MAHTTRKTQTSPFRGSQWPASRLCQQLQLRQQIAQRTQPLLYALTRDHKKRTSPRTLPTALYMNIW